MPFSMGVGNRAGKRVALMEVSSVVARTAWGFDFGFLVGREVGEGFFAGIKDCFVAGLPDVEMVFRERVR